MKNAGVVSENPLASVMVVLVAMLLLLSGCRGEAATDAPPPPETFTFFAPRPMPRSSIPASDRVKPGHWTSISTSVRSNASDLRGDLLVEVSTQPGSQDTVGLPGAEMFGNANGGGDSANLSPEALQIRESRREGVAGQRSTSQRSVVMPSGQRRRFDIRLLPPSIGGMNAREVLIHNRLLPENSATIDMGGGIIRCLDSQEYFLVALSDRPERIGQLATADWMRPPIDLDAISRRGANYSIAVPPAGGVIPLPESPLDWTSIAVLWWDNLPADQMTENQLSSLIDWLHLGGRLVVAGSSAVDAIRGSVLEKWMPIRDAGNAELDLDTAANMLMHWSVDGDASVAKVESLLRGRNGRLASDGVIDRQPENTSQRPAMEIEGTGGLVATRRVGRGVIVQTRFDLTSDWMDAWDSGDSFFNAVVLGRPPRSYVAKTSTLPAEVAGYDQVYPTLQSSRADAMMNTGVRIASRDALLRQGSAEPNLDVEPRSLFRNAAGSMAAWNDQSDVVNVCIDLLRSQSGIVIPKGSSVVRWLAIYLAILVPLNFIVFRLLGRLEWAWLAIPLIAIGGAVWMARAAQLDIGFSRSIHQISLLELPADSPRGHMSSVTAIYNSLSSVYQASFDGVASAASALPSARESAAGNDGGSIRWRELDDGRMSLSGIPIASNQIRMVHGEEMVEVGKFDFDGERLVNRTAITWHEAVVVRRRASDGQFEWARVGKIDPQSSVSLDFRSGPLITSEDAPLQVNQLMASLCSPLVTPEGSVRLIARSGEFPASGPELKTEGVSAANSSDIGELASAAENDSPSSIGSFRIEPAASQNRQCTILLAHLRYPDLPRAEKDRSLLPAKGAPNGVVGNEPMFQ